MARHLSIREQIARAWYELHPASVDGMELPFEQAPAKTLIAAYQWAGQVLTVLRQEAA